MKIYQTILKPVLSEKSTNLVKNDYYMFEVDIQANKYQIKQALEKLYPVKVAEVKTNLRQGKTRKVGRQMREKKLSSRKIVFVKLKSGKIDLFPKA
jgi:large subunit ribosomal protein L23